MQRNARRTHERGNGKIVCHAVPAESEIERTSTPLACAGTGQLGLRTNSARFSGNAPTGITFRSLRRLSPARRYNLSSRKHDFVTFAAKSARYVQLGGPIQRCKRTSGTDAAPGLLVIFDLSRRVDI